MATCALHNYICLHNYEDDIDFSHIGDGPFTPTCQRYEINNVISTLENEYTFSKKFTRELGIAEKNCLKKEITETIFMGFIENLRCFYFLRNII